MWKLFSRLLFQPFTVGSLDSRTGDLSKRIVILSAETAGIVTDPAFCKGAEAGKFSHGFAAALHIVKIGIQSLRGVQPLLLGAVAARRADGEGALPGDRKKLINFFYR